MDFDEGEPQSVGEERFGAERAERKSARRSAALDLRGAHLGAAVTTIVLALLGWSGKLIAVGVITGVLLLGFAAALTWAYADGDHGRHALQRAYGLTFGWGNGI